jgi:hypothetical protein
LEIHSHHPFFDGFSMENKNQPAIYWGMAMAMETPQHTMPKTPKSGGHLTIIFIVSENHEILREADT